MAQLEKVGRTVRHVAPGPVRSPVRRLRVLHVLLVIVPVLVFLVFSASPYLRLDPGLAAGRLQSPAHYWIIAGHALTGTVALVSLTLLLWPGLHVGHPAVHRWAGRCYVFGGALPSAAFVGVVLPLAYPAGRIGAATASALWSVTAVLGWVRARQGRWVEHRRWMLLSAAITYGFVIVGFALFQAWFRLRVPGVGIGEALEAARWFAWVVPLLAMRWWLDRTADRPLGLATPPADAPERTGRPG